jgi:hypothetical protein
VRSTDWFGEAHEPVRQRFAHFFLHPLDVGLRLMADLFSTLPDLAGRLHVAVAWVLLPLAALLAASGALRPELPPAWRRALGLAAAVTAAAVGLLAARYALAHLDTPWWVIALTPPMCLVWAYGASDSRLAVLFFTGVFAVSVMAWAVLALRVVGGTTAVLLANDLLLAAALALLMGTLWKHLATPRPPEPPAPPPARPPDPREAELQQRLASEAAQEAADKYTRD